MNKPRPTADDHAEPCIVVVNSRVAYGPCPLSVAHAYRDGLGTGYVAQVVAVEIRQFAEVKGGGQ